MLLLRRLHKWIGLVFGLQLLIWALSGATMAMLDKRQVSGETALRSPAPVSAPSSVASLQTVAEAVGAPLVSLDLKPLSGLWVYEAVTPFGPQILDAATAAPITVDAGFARRQAVARFQGDAEVRSVERVTEPTLDTRDLTLPVWRVGFADRNNTALMVSEATGGIVAARTDAWRIWDVAMMMHIMDYRERRDINHPMLTLAATGAAWLVLTGLLLLIRSFCRADVAWLLDWRFARR